MKLRRRATKLRSRAVAPGRRLTLKLSLPRAGAGGARCQPATLRLKLPARGRRG